MAEIYTGDFYSIVEEYVDKIVDKVDIRSDYYVVGDEMHDCFTNIRKKLYERLSEQFKNLCDEYETDLYNVEIRNSLFKIINEI